MNKITLALMVFFEMLSSGLGWKAGVLQHLKAVYFEENVSCLLGETSMDIGERPADLRTTNKNINRGIQGLRVRAYPEQAVTSLEGGQTIYVIVQDQRLIPAQGAQVSLEIRMPSGEEDRIIFPTLTDKNGFAQYSFSYKTGTIGIVEINVTVVYEKLQATTSTCFWLWW
jgi:hypothetical protein